MSHHTNQTTSTLIHFDHINCTLQHDTTIRKLDPIIVRLLDCFLSAPNQIQSRENLAKQVWQSDYVSDEAINRCISVLRKALSAERSTFIKTVPKKGYLFTIPPHFKIVYTPNNQITNPAANLNTNQINTEHEIIKPLDKSAATMVDEKSIDEKSVDEKSVDEKKEQNIDNLFEPYEANTSQHITNQPNSHATAQNTFSISKFWGLSLISLLFICLLVWFVVNAHFETTPPIETQPLIPHTGNIKVILQINTHDDSRFRDLYINILTQITSIKNFKVVANIQQNPETTSPHNYLSSLTEDQANYALIVTQEPTNRQHRFTIKLLDITKQSYSSSIVLDYSNSPAEDENINQILAQQAAAALRIQRLQLLHKKEYFTGYSNLDYITIEKIIIAQQYANRPTLSSLPKSIEILNQLHQEYPNDLTIMGELAKSLSISLNRNLNPNQQQRHNLTQLLTAILDREPTNFYALDILYLQHFSQPHLRMQAAHIVQSLITHHPDQQRAWRHRLHWLVKTHQPCDVIQKEVQAIPKGIFKPHRFAAIQILLDACLHNTSLESYLQQHANQPNDRLIKALFKKAYLFSIVHDHIFTMIQYRHQANPNEVLTAEMYWAQLAMGDELGASTARKLIAQQANPRLQWRVNILDTIYDVNQTAWSIPQLLEFYKHQNLNDVYLITSLIHHARETQDPQHLHHLLSQLNKFDIALVNKDQTLLLMAAQYHAGLLSESQKTAQKLFNILKVYQENHDKSYYFWSLGRYQLISKFYCQSLCTWEQNMDVEQQFQLLFGEDHLWWPDDLGFSRLLLSPWSTDPLVKAYLEAIEQDRLRVKSKLGL